MLDALLANQLVKAVAPGTHLLLVGDPDQLPSVGAGDVLADLLRSGHFPITRLTHIFRQGAGSGIAMRGGSTPGRCRPSGAQPDCFFLPAEDPATAAETAVDVVAQRLPQRYGFERRGPGALADAPWGRGGRRAQHPAAGAAQPGGEGVPEARGGGRVYRAGDRVLQLHNDYTLEVFNGDLGTVARSTRSSRRCCSRSTMAGRCAIPSRACIADPCLCPRPQGAGGGVPGGGHPAGDQPRGDAGADAPLHRVDPRPTPRRHRRAATGPGAGGQGLAAGLANHGLRRVAQRVAALHLAPACNPPMPEEESALLTPEAWEGLLGEATA